MAFRWGDLTREGITKNNYPDEAGYQDALRRFDDKEREVKEAEANSHVLYAGTETDGNIARIENAKKGNPDDSFVAKSGKDFVKQGSWDAQQAKSRVDNAIDKNAPNARNMGDPDVNKRLSALGVAQNRMMQNKAATEAYRQATSK